MAASVLNCQVLYPSFIDSAIHDQIIKEFQECESNKVLFYLSDIKEGMLLQERCLKPTAELQESTRGKRYTK